MLDYFNNRIYNKILDRDWFPGRQFSRNRRDHVGVQLQVSDLNFFVPVIGFPRDFHVNYVHFDGFLRNVFYSFQNLGKALQTFSLKRSS